MISEEDWISVFNDPEQHQHILATNGKSIHSGVYYAETGKLVLDDGLQYEAFSDSSFRGRYCSLEDNYTHWMAAPQLPKQNAD